MTKANLTDFAAAIFVSSAVATGAFAQQQGGFSIGVGSSFGNNIYIGESDGTQFLPLVRYDSDQFSVSLPEGLRVSISDTGAFRFSGVLSPRFSAIDASDAPELEGLDRTLTWDGGLLAEYQLGKGAALSLRLVTELSDEHGGSEADFSVVKPILLGSLPIALGAGVIWQSADLGDYLYGVSASEATVDRAAYSVDDTVTPYVSVGTSFPVSDRVRIVGNVRAAVLPDEISDSSIVDEDVELRAFIGVNLSL